MDKNKLKNYQLDGLGDPNLFHDPIDISEFPVFAKRVSLLLRDRSRFASDCDWSPEGLALSGADGSVPDTPELHSDRSEPPGQPFR